MDNSSVVTPCPYNKTLSSGVWVYPPCPTEKKLEAVLETGRIKEGGGEGRGGRGEGGGGGGEGKRISGDGQELTTTHHFS